MRLELERTLRSPQTDEVQRRWQLILGLTLIKVEQRTRFSRRGQSVCVYGCKMCESVWSWVYACAWAHKLLVVCVRGKSRAATATELKLRHRLLLLLLLSQCGLLLDYCESFCRLHNDHIEAHTRRQTLAHRALVTVNWLLAMGNRQLATLCNRQPAAATTEAAAATTAATLTILVNLHVAATVA